MGTPLRKAFPRSPPGSPNLVTLLTYGCVAFYSVFYFRLEFVLQHPMMTTSSLPVLSGTVLKMHLHVGVDESGLLGKICTEMLDEASRQSTATSGMVTNQSVCYRLINCLRSTFCALDYIGCAVNSDTQSDFERIDEAILLNQADQECVDKA